MRVLGVSEKSYRIDTIASWALRLSLSYSGTSGWEIDRPDDNEQWGALYEACARLLDHEFIRRIVRASYDGLYVDEYQDCSIAQHGIVLKLARDLPSRVLGDPLQGIFDFGGQNPGGPGPVTLRPTLCVLGCSTHRIAGFKRARTISEGG